MNNLRICCMGERHIVLVFGRYILLYRRMHAVERSLANIGFSAFQTFGGEGPPFLLIPLPSPSLPFSHTP